MSAQLLVVLLIAGVAVIYSVVAIIAYRRMRGTRIIVCPETQEPAAVEVDAGHAALSAVREHDDIRLQQCSRWPERANCNQACTSQIAVAPEHTLVFEILQRWYAGKRCAMCKRPIPVLSHVGPKPGLLNVASQETLSWEEIPAENLPAMFETHLAVCAHCQVAETFRRRFPDLVVERRNPDQRGGTTVH